MHVASIILDLDAFLEAVKASILFRLEYFYPLLFFKLNKENHVARARNQSKATRYYDM